MNRTCTVTALALAALLGGLAACASDQGPTEPVSFDSGRSHSSRSHKDLCLCAPQAYSKTVKTVGPEGGSINAGKHQLKIPANALSAPVTITMESMPDSVVNVRFSPDGLTFNPAWQPTLTMSVNDCSLPPGAKIEMAYVDSSLSVISLLPATWDKTASKVSAYLPHFSRYAVHY
jgi:hypothetical protein